MLPALPSDVLLRPVAALGVPRLDPNQLGSMAMDAEQALLREGESENTLRSYRSALRYWAAWFALRYGQAITLPVSEAAVIQFIVEHAQRTDADGRLVTEMPTELDAELVRTKYKAKPGPLSLNTLVHRISVLSKVHQLEQQPNPCAQPRVRELLAKTRRAYAKRGALPHKKPALTRDPLELMLETCDTSLTGLRDRALLLFAFSSGGRRRSEVTAATMDNTHRTHEGFSYHLAHSKTNQTAAARAENDKPIVGRAAEALNAWLCAAGITSGALFRRVRRGDVVAEPLAPSAVRDIVRNRCLLAGLSTEYSAHSLRSGFVTEAGRQNMPLAETMALTGHRSTASLVGYHRHSQQATSTARLMDTSPALASVAEHGASISHAVAERGLENEPLPAFTCQSFRGCPVRSVGDVTRT